MKNVMCCKCGLYKDASSFTYSKRTANKLRTRCKLCESEDRKDIDKRNKLKVIRYYSNGTFLCECCEENKIEFLTVDHVLNDGAELRKKDPSQYQIYRWILRNDYPDGFRILCINCNFSLGIWGYCPHKSESLFTDDLKSRIDKAKRCQGEKCKSAKITEDDVRKIRTLFSSGCKMKDLLKQFPINESSIYKICRRKTWKHIL